MKERPILFSAPMVRALMAGTKTQTRRALRVQPPAATVQVSTWHHPDPRPMFFAWTRNCPELPDHPTGGAEISDWPPLACPYGQPGDRLWVREAWQAFFDDEVPSDRPRGPRHTLGQPSQPDRKSFVFYRADGPGPVHPDGFQARWISPLHLPRKCSRITLEIVSVRVERLQDISEADAVAEGLTFSAAARRSPGCLGIYECRMPDGKTHFDINACDLYRKLWDQISGPGSWGANPWVWVIDFKRVEASHA